MWARKRLDIGWSDLAFGVFRCLLPCSLSARQQRVEAAWSDSGDALACLSVRSGFDLLLSALGLAPGSEVLMSALTIGDLPRIVEQHGLVPVPVDLDIDCLAPTLESMGRAMSPAARAIVVAHLFGSRSPMEPVLDVARRRGLLVVEDCAQAFDGRYRGRAEADVSMFSFGPIKTATALQGAIVRVRDRELLEQMRRRQAEYPVQRSRACLKRLAKYAVLKALSAPWLFGAFVGFCHAAGCDVDRLINRSARGFPGPDLERQIRQRPSPPLLALLERRLRTFDHARLAQRKSRGELLADLLGDRVPRPGAAAAPHTHWVFPILAEEPQRTIDVLRQAGYDATQGQSMCVVRPPPDRPELFPTAAASALTKAVYLPFYPEMPVEAIERMARLLVRECDRSRGVTARVRMS